MTVKQKLSNMAFGYAKKLRAKYYLSWGRTEDTFPRASSASGILPDRADEFNTGWRTEHIWSIWTIWTFYRPDLLLNHRWHSWPVFAVLSAYTDEWTTKHFLMHPAVLHRLVYSTSKFWNPSLVFVWDEDSGIRIYQQLEMSMYD